jgi:hypothetical protein
MAEKNVGIIYQNNENWIGGAYYIENLIAALLTLPPNQQFPLTVFASDEKDFEQIRKTEYKKLAFRQIDPRPLKLSMVKRGINKFSKVATGHDRWPQPFQLDLDGVGVVFPSAPGLQTPAGTRKVCWIPDFQEQELPEFFSKKEIELRTESHRFIANSNADVVFSSQNAFDTFARLFPRATAKRHVLRFAVTHPKEYKSLDSAALRLKYNINAPFFFAPNQFWKHKDQPTILRAVLSLKQAGIKDFIVAFSGREHDYRNPEYPGELKKFVNDNELGAQIRFLGFIDRCEQLKLMSEAIAVIQPSLFEGWSTVVEDAKAMDQWTIATGIPAHREQLEKNVSFFDAGDDRQLASILRKGIEEGFQKQSFLYDLAVKKFAADFSDIINR